jgi:hypothetical protein
MKRSKGDSDHDDEEVKPDAAAGRGRIMSESKSQCHRQEDSSDNSGPSECDSDMDVSEPDNTAAKKTKVGAKKGKKLYNPKKVMGAHRYKTKFDDKWLKKHADCKGKTVNKDFFYYIF